jgi:RNase H-like domain found in reverse transcriptase
MFLSRLLNRYEKNYWPTELEVACLVWVLKKIRHLVEAAEEPPVVWTDHAATVSIAKQTSMSTTATDRLNLRLIQAAQYIQQFRLKLHYKPGKANTVPDALSRLPSDTEPPPETPILDALHIYSDDAKYAFTAALVELTPEFKASIVNGYTSDSKWKSLREDLRSKTTAKLPYEESDELLYSISQDGTGRNETALHPAFSPSAALQVGA